MHFGAVMSCVLLTGVLGLTVRRPTITAGQHDDTTPARPQRPQRPSLFDSIFGSQFGAQFPESPVIKVPFSRLGQRWQAVEMMMRYLDEEMNAMMQEVSRELGSLFPIDREREEWCVSHPIITESNGTKIMRVTLDMRQFTADEINMKVRNNVLYVSARQETKTDITTVFKLYSRQFAIPEGVIVDQIRSTFSPEGIMTITAPLEESEETGETDAGKEQEKGSKEEEEEEQEEEEEKEEEEEGDTTPPPPPTTTTTTVQPTLPEVPLEALPERKKKEETINIIHE